MQTALALVVPGGLAVGPQPTPAELAWLRRAGVTAILCLRGAEEAPRPSRKQLGGLRWARVPIGDGHLGEVMSLERLERAVAVIELWRDEGHLVYVHCLAGVGRAPTVCAAYLAVAEGIEAGAALARIRQARPAASPSAQQLLVLSQLIIRRRRSPVSQRAGSTLPPGGCIENLP